MKKILFIFYLLLISDIGFAQWVQQYSGTTRALRRVRFINRNTGWICGDAGIILKTTNGGVNWINQSSGLSNKILADIFPVNENLIYAVGFFETFLKSTNGGNNWVILENGIFGNSHSYESCFFLNELTGWIGTSFPGTRKTTDGGITFMQQNVNDIPEDIYFKDSINGNFSAGGSVGKTTDGGNNWIVTIISTGGIGLEDFKRISFINSLTGFIVGDAGTTYKTTNFGISWDSIGFISQNTNFIHSSQFANESVGYAGGGGQIFKTTTGGRSWKLQNSGAIGFLPSVFCFSDSIVWVVGNPGHIWFTSSGGQTGINTISQNIPETFKLNQNYPNPFNPSTKIKFSIKIKGNYKLEIFNSLGQLMEILFDKKINEGEYEYKFDAGNYITGIYFYRLSSDNFTQSKKMMLIK